MKSKLDFGTKMKDLIFENSEFLNSNQAFPIRVLSEWIYPRDQIKKWKITDTIVLFGSARIPSPEEVAKEEQIILSRSSPDAERIWQNKKSLLNSYKDAQEFAKKISEWGENLPVSDGPRKLVVCTGGGPGIMEAGNRGAKESGFKSLALNIQLPYEQGTNPYADPEMSFRFKYFFMRKYWFIKLCRGMVAFPGGFGTMDELFEALTLVQTRKISKIPIVLYNSNFWKKMIHFEMMVDYGLIQKEDLKLFHYADSAEDAFQFLKENIHF